jgi:uncharacterized PurR-regulated membrane protein YhhQ (DUF165 family)
MARRSPQKGTIVRRRLTATVAAAAFVATVWFVNWLVDRYGAIRVWPTDLRAPAGVYAVGLAFLLRDTVQRLAGTWLALASIAAGTALTYMVVSHTLAEASAAGFVTSELAGLAVFKAARGNTGGPPVLGTAVVLAGLVAAAVDSYVFLSIAFHSLAFFEGQFVAKVTVTVLALPFVLGARRQWPTRELAPRTGAAA